MKQYEFVIVASGLDHASVALENRLVSAGCSDATVSFQRRMIIFDFCRGAPSFEAAIVSGMRDVEKSGAIVRGIEPGDLVSLAEIARRSNLTRSAISNYFSGVRSSDFPTPMTHVTTESPLWSWAEVAQWLHGKERVGSEMVDAARVIAALNADLAHRTAAEVLERLRVAAA
jgi:transcriptional regulator with XRE-family HTH domain